MSIKKIRGKTKRIRDGFGTFRTSKSSIEREHLFFCKEARQNFARYRVARNKQPIPIKCVCRLRLCKKQAIQINYESTVKCKPLNKMSS